MKNNKNRNHALQQIFFPILILLGISISPIASAGIIVIDFDTATVDSILTTDYIEDGFTFESTSGHYDIISSGGTGNTQYLGLDAIFPDSSDLRLTGGIFDLTSLETFGYAEGSPLIITSSAGGFIQIEIDTIQTFTGADWTSLSWVNFSTDINIALPGLDTITLATAAIPIPAAIWLFGSGLTCLFVTARRKTV